MCNSSANIKLSKTQLYKIGQSEGFLRGIVGPLLQQLKDQNINISMKSFMIDLWEGPNYNFPHENKKALSKFYQKRHPV